MTAPRFLLLLIALTFGAVSTAAAPARDLKIRAQFHRDNPCPDPAVRIRPGTAGGRRGACPGFQVDHIVPLCAGGPDATANMHWLSVADHRAKTVGDLRLCRSLRLH